MDEKKNGKTKIWVYAVVLFTSAFIVLLLTAYSQIRLNKNLSSYKDQINNTESERNQYQLNFSSAQETNNKLKAENDKLKAEKTEISDKLALSEKEKVQNNENNKKVLNEYDKLSSAQAYYLNEDFVASALLLSKDIDTRLLDAKGKELYDLLLTKTSPKAGKILYREGYEYYTKKDYANAIAKLTLSFEIAPLEDFSGSCLYFLALSEDKTGNKSKAVELMGEVFGKYPDSYYASKAKSYYEKNSK